VRLSAAQRRVLGLCAEGLTPLGCTVYGVRRATLTRLELGGLIRFRSYAKEPHWAVTAAGRAALKEQET
jgi:hypothetical protein